MSTRVHSLDGLRGLAALIVVVHHAMLTFPALAAPYLSGQNSSEPWVQWLAYTPLHAFWEGQSAVYVFFVLSGLVLTLPVLARGKDYSWVAYYPQRLIRLYVPVWAAVLVGVLWLLVVPRTAEMASLWLERRAVAPEVWRILRDVTLLAGPGGVVSPLWSLRWEIIFSLLLPLFVFVGVKLMRFRWVTLVACIALITVGGATGIEPLLFLPMFMLGVVVATVLPDVVRSGINLPRWAALALTVAAPVLLITPWLARPLGLDVVTGVLEGAAAVGALVAVYAAITVPYVRRFLSTRVMQWFGLISFSLYLVHEPIIISSAFLFGDEMLLPAALVGIAVSVPVAWIFYRVIEVPSHKLARRVGDMARTRMGRRPQSHAPLSTD